MAVMPNLILPNLGPAFIDVFWTTPGGAGGVRVASITLSLIAIGGQQGFTVIIPDSGNGSEADLRRRAYVAIQPAVRRMRTALDRDPARVASVERVVTKPLAAIRFEVASEDGRRRAFYNARVTAFAGESDEDLVLKASPKAFRFFDALAKDLEALVGPAA